MILDLCLLTAFVGSVAGLSAFDGAAMVNVTPADLLAIAERNLRTLDIVVDRLIEAGATSEVQAVVSHLQEIIWKVTT